jgi:cell division protein FtsB
LEIDICEHCQQKRRKETMKATALLLILFLATKIAWAGQISGADSLALAEQKVMQAKAELEQLKLSLDSTEAYLKKLDNRHKSASQYLESTEGALDTLPTRPELEQNINFQREVCLIPARTKGWPTEKYEKIIAEKTELLTIVDSLNLWTTEARHILDTFENNKRLAEERRDQLTAKIVAAEDLFESLRAGSVFDAQVDKFVKAKKVYGHSFNEWVGCGNDMFEAYAKTLADSSLPESLKVEIDFSKIGITKDSLLNYLETARPAFNEAYKYWLAQYDYDYTKSTSHCFPAILIPNLKIPIGVYTEILGIKNGLSRVDDFLESPWHRVAEFKFFKKIDIPESGPYILADLENGKMMQGVSPYDFLFDARILHRRTGLTTVEILSAVIAKPELFVGFNIYSAVDSYCDDAPCLRVGRDLDSQGQRNLDLWNHGGASCFERLKAVSQPSEIAKE